MIFLLLFLFLFLKTDYSGSDRLEYAVNLIFRIDPYLTLITIGAAKTFIGLMVPGLIVLALAVVLGRGFCGWLCPMGTLLDLARKITGTDRAGRTTLYPRASQLILLFTFLLALGGVHLAGYVDPFSILVRGMAIALYPAFHGTTEAFFTFTYTSMPPAVNAISEPVYQVLREYILPVERKFFELAYLSLFLLGLVVGLEMLQKRFFCRNICPVGALLGLVSRHGFLRAEGGDEGCGRCRLCSSVCRMGAINEDRTIDMAACNLCFECVVKCPQERISIGYGLPAGPVERPGVTRRQFLAGLVTGVLLPSVKGANHLAKRYNPELIRPPGALEEGLFTGRCVRCGECMQVCIGNALQPTLLEGGFDALFTPKLVVRTGYCEFNCTLCGQVCPTGALSILSEDEKHRFKVGHAFFDHDTCLPWAKNIPCMVCEEHCPTPEKAIRFREVEAESEAGVVRIKRPYIVDALCIGCGICEYKCPLPGRAAIVVTSAGEQRNPGNRLPETTRLGNSSGYG